MNLVNEQTLHTLIAINCNDNPLQYSCLENPMEEEPDRTTDERVAESQTQLGD